MLHRVLAIAAMSALFAPALGGAHAAPLVRLDFTGRVDIISPPGSLSGVVGDVTSPAALNAVNGYLIYDAGIPATSPGRWTLHTATYHATFGNLTIDAVGATAFIGTSFNSGIQFDFAIPPGEFPFPVTAANGSLSIQTLRDNSFDPLALPTTVLNGSPDESTGFSYTTADGSRQLVNTGTVLRITATLVNEPANVPEPASALLLGAGLAGLALLRKHRL